MILLLKIIYLCNTEVIIQLECVCFLYTAHFPFLEFFIAWAFKYSKVHAAYKTLISTAVGLINARRQAAEPAKVLNYLISS